MNKQSVKVGTKMEKAYLMRESKIVNRLYSS